MYMIFEDFLKLKSDNHRDYCYDVYSDKIDLPGKAITLPVKLTEVGKKEFEPLLKCKVYAYPWCSPNVHVELHEGRDYEEDDILLELLEDFVDAAAGRISTEDYERIFEED